MTVYHTSGQTRVVIIIHITYKPVQSSVLTVDSQGTVNPQGGELRMGYDEIFDVSPPTGVGDIVLPTAEVQRLALHIFGSL